MSFIKYFFLAYFFTYFLALAIEIYNTDTYNDAAVPWQIDFQDPATPIMEGIIDLHHHIFFFLIFVAIFVIWLVARAILLFNTNSNVWPYHLSNANIIEVVWTFLPIIILILIAQPSLYLLYAADEVIDAAITIKAIGHQWYWSYEYSDYALADGTSITFDSYMVPESSLKQGDLRLLEVDERIVVPVNTHVRVLVTAADVLHSWAVPSLGVKVDGVPGRLNQLSFFIKREGIYYGQCSELCGENHGFMPIVVEAVSLDNYISWLANNG